MKLLYSKAISDRSLTFFLPHGSYGAFVIMFEGTNGGVAATRDDLGQVQLTWNGNPLINVDAELISYLDDLKLGFSTFTSVVSDTLLVSLFIPCGMFADDNNCYLIDKNDQVYFKLDYPDLADLAGISGTVSIYGIPKMGINNYWMSLQSRNVVAGGAGLISDTYRVNNISQVYLKNYSNVSKIQLTKDGDLKFDGNTDSIKALSDINNRVESAGDIIELDFNPTKSIFEIIGNEIGYQYTFDGADTLEQYFCYNVLTPNHALKSQSRVKSHIARINPKPIYLPLGGIGNLVPKNVNSSGSPEPLNVGSPG